jgi:flavin-dependent dehydrogenase
MNKSPSDCAIIGGGLAGLCLAIQLADSGRKVILFEKEKYPFHKVCGEYISMESHDFLERIGIPLKELNLPYITELKISAPDGSSLTRRLKPGGFGISRHTLDGLLAGIARKKGVELMESTRVNEVLRQEGGFLLKTATSEYKTRLVCGAYGKRSHLDRNAGRIGPGSNPGAANYVAVKYHVQLEFPENRIELHNFKGGYGGLSKVDGDRYCFCYMTNSVQLRENGNNIKTMERNILMQNPFLKDYFSRAGFLFERPLTIAQITFGKKSQVEDGMLLLGDAAGTVAPLCGNGMSMAMRASGIASMLIVEHLEGRISEAQLSVEYEKAWNEAFSARIRAGALIQPFFGKTRLTNLTLGLFRTMPWIADKIISATHGQPF